MAFSRVIAIGSVVTVMALVAVLVWQNTHTAGEEAGPIDADTLQGRTVEELLKSNKPIDAATLAGHPGLHYLDAANLTGVISTEAFSAYEDLIDEEKIIADGIIVTRDQLDKAISQQQSLIQKSQEPKTIVSSAISSVAAGIGLTGGGSSGKVSLSVVVGKGLIIKNNAITAVLGDDIDLLTEVAGVLSVAHGGTGRNTAPANGQFLIGDGAGYGFGQLVAGDGVTLSRTGNTFTYAVDSTVCRTSGNCSGVGENIDGSGVANQIAFFSDEDTLTSHAGLAWNSGAQSIWRALLPQWPMSGRM